MQPDSMVKLVGSGNTSTVEEEWLKLLDSKQAPPSQLQTYHPVLAELVRIGKTPQAEVLATTTIETLAPSHDALDVVRMAAAFLLAIGDSAGLRMQVADLYRAAFPDRDELDGLIQVAGLQGGRPVRRALRTLEVCLSLGPGDYLKARDDDTAARVNAIDSSNWTYTIGHGGAKEELDAVTLADRYQRAESTEFAVIKHFQPDKLAGRLQEDPASFVLDLAVQRDGKIDSSILQSLLVPDVFTADAFEKWWSKARAAIRKHPNLKMEGRSPYYITHVESPAGGSDALFLADFRRHRDPYAQLECADRYIKDCKSRGASPSPDVLNNFHQLLRAQAEQATEKGAVPPAILWLLTWRLGQMADENEIPPKLTAHLASAADLVPLFRNIEDDRLAAMALEALCTARNDWPEQLLNLLPHLPMGVCDLAVERLVSAGRSMSEVHAVVQNILSLPIESFDALLWLWDGPKNPEVLAGVSSVTVLTRILRALDDCRRDDRVPRALAKKLANRARSVLGGRRYERFSALVKAIDRGMAMAFRTQISQLDNLGRSVPEDMLTLLGRAFPLREAQPAVPGWQRDDILYVTEAGMARKRAEIDHHVNVKMRDNARAIGAAAEHGDLSENSEYKFALEERDLLRARLGQMNAELAIAKVISPDDVSTSEVGVGSKVIFRRIGDEAPYELTLVGPWEAEHSRGLFNYRAPLAQAILGKQVGDVVEFAHGENNGQYRIVEIQNGLENLSIKAFEALPKGAHDYHAAPH